MWRTARLEEDDAVIAMCLELYREDPGPTPIAPEQMRRTLEVLRREPWRGLVAVLQIDGQAVGYAILIAFWSNELGGEVCEVDELFVAREQRNRGHGRSLFAAISAGSLWPGPITAIALGVTPDNTRARRLYESLGFAAVGTSMVRRV
jgi:ribosomal protein S18 acetylase RimI-like enzyme